jgi:dTDP-4-amino-4,6-dideoxygalactose transaminase
VLVPTFTFPATAEVVALLGATPVLVDVNSETFNTDASLVGNAVEAARAAGLMPRALIAVDLYGRPAPYGELNAVCEKSGLLLIADAAQSFGASLGGSPVGSLAPVTTTSFFPAKPLGCYGDGGCVFTDDAVRADRLASIRSHGRGADKYDIVRPGLNARLDTIQAAVLLEKLAVFEEELGLRRRVAAQYHALLGSTVQCPPEDDEASFSAWAQYTVRVPRRSEVVAALDVAGIPSAVYYPRPLHLQPAYASYRLPGQDFTAAERLCAEVLSLPMHPYLTEPEQQKVAATVKAAVTT